jgi:serine/threonine protein kinase
MRGTELIDDARDSAEVPVPGDDAASMYVNALPPGTRLYEFELLRPLGEGGFGVVYLAFDHSLHRNVAIKEYLPSAYAVRRNNQTIAARSGQHQATFEAGLRSFIKEARLLAQFDHPALVKVHRFWEGNGTAYMAMSYYPGQTLADILRADRTYATETRLKGLIAPLLDAVSQLHAQQCFHRDISPENVIVQPNGAPVLLDFGAARRIIGDMTQALTVVLKPGYAPIEQYVEDGGLVQGPWTDVYGFAALLYCAVVGKPPPAAVTRAYKDALVPLADNPPAGFDLQFLRGIDAGLAVKPEERPASLAEFRDLLGLASVADTQQTVIIPKGSGGAGVPTGPRSAPGAATADRLTASALASAGASAPSTVAESGAPAPAVAPSSAASPLPLAKGSPQAGREAHRSRAGLWLGGGLVAIAGVVAAVGWTLGWFRPATVPGTDRPAAVARNEAAPQPAPGVVESPPPAPASSAGRPAGDRATEPAAALPAPVEPAASPPAAPPSRVEPAAPPKAVPPKDTRAPAVVEPADRATRDKAVKDKPVAAPTVREAPRTPPVEDRRPPAESRPTERPASVPERVAPAPAPEPSPRIAKADTERGGEATLPPRELSDEGRRLFLSANTGNAGAQNALANMYYNGRGAPQSDAEAVRWWSKAAEQGNLNAQNNLGFMYYSGRGVTKDQSEGARWWLKAAEHGFAAAQNNIGGAYRNGLGVAKNEQEAVKWYRRSAEQGHAGSQKALGDMYYFGLGVPKEEAEAITWYRRAADNGNLQAADQLKAIESLRAK